MCNVVVSHLVFGPSNRAVLNPSGCYIETRGVRIKGLSVSISSSYNPRLWWAEHTLGTSLKTRKIALNIFLGYFCVFLVVVSPNGEDHLSITSSEYLQNIGRRQTELFIAQLPATKLWLAPGSVASSVFTITVYTLQVWKVVGTWWDGMG